MKHEIREAPGAGRTSTFWSWGRAGRPTQPDRWGENWVGLAQRSAQADPPSAALQREVQSGHPLFERRLRAIARCGAT